MGIEDELAAVNTSIAVMRTEVAERFGAIEVALADAGARAAGAEASVQALGERVATVEGVAAAMLVNPPEPDPEPTPDPEPAPNPEPTPDPEPAPDPEPTPEPDPEPEKKDEPPKPDEAPKSSHWLVRPIRKGRK